MTRIYTYIFDFGFFRKTKKLHNVISENLEVYLDLSVMTAPIGISKNNRFIFKIEKKQFVFFLKDDFSKDELKSLEFKLEKIIEEMDYKSSYGYLHPKIKPDLEMLSI